jgi:hypothetical protein
VSWANPEAEQLEFDSLAGQNPSDQISDGIKDLWCGTYSEGEGTINVGVFFPPNPEQVIVSRTIL